tara:strand:- start:272 stop:388 length:117 start_codon:yes stop_codon:yes gene_type:complete
MPTPTTLGEDAAAAAVAADRRRRRIALDRRAIADGSIG